MVYLVASFFFSSILSTVQAKAVPSPTNNVADYILTGLSAERKERVHNTTATMSTGSAFAQSCSSVIQAWSDASMSWASAHTTPSTTTQIISPYTYTASGPSIIKATSLTTLCDGHPRVVGTATTKDASSVAMSFPGTTQIETFEYQGSYTVPSPTCTINPTDCLNLYSEELKTTSFPNIFNLCTTPPATSTVPTGPNGLACDQCYIRARYAQLLYWPVRTKVGTGNLCGNKTAEIIHGTPTGVGPNTAVIGDLTITSPTVAVSFEDMGRIDGCYQTIPHTIVTALPEQITSVRGARALFNYAPFDFQDLNYRCQPANSSTYTIQDQNGDDCYQEVPAEAYFYGNQEWAQIGGWPSSVTAHLTIGDKYAPQILPPPAVEELATKVWGTSCFIHPDGVWDPPLALQEVPTIQGPTLPGGVKPTSVQTSKATALPEMTTSATPAGHSITQPPATHTPTTSAGPTKIVFTQTNPTITLDATTYTFLPVGPSAHGLQNEHTTILLPSSGGVQIGTNVVSLATPSNTKHGEVGGGPGIYIDGTRASQAPPSSDPAVEPVTIGSESYMVSAGESGGYVVQGSGTAYTLSPSGSAVTIGGGEVTAGTDGLVVNTPSSSITKESGTKTESAASRGSTSSSAGVMVHAPVLYSVLSLMFLSVMLI